LLGPALLSSPLFSPQQPEVYSQPLAHGEKKLKGRTGWPQQVWALELNP